MHHVGISNAISFRSIHPSHIYNFIKMRCSYARVTKSTLKLVVEWEGEGEKTLNAMFSPAILPNIVTEYDMSYFLFVKYFIIVSNLLSGYDLHKSDVYEVR